MASIQVPQAKPHGMNPANWIAHGVVILLCLLTIFPFVWMLSTVVQDSDRGLHQRDPGHSAHPTLQNYPDAFNYFPVAHWFWNSLFIAVMTTAGKLVISVPAAFAFARLKFRGSGLLFALVLGTMIVPSVVTYVPNYVMISKLQWIDTSQGVIVPSIAHSRLHHLPASAIYPDDAGGNPRRGPARRRIDLAMLTT